MKSTLLVFSGLLFLAACSSSTKAPEVKKEAYAKLGTKRIFEYPLEKVRDATLAVAQAYPILSQKEEKDHVTVIETDWILVESRDKYVNYKKNEHMRHKSLQSRIKYSFKVAPVLGGAEVSVKTTEEVEALKADGTSAGFKSVKNSDLDSSRASEFLDRVGTEILKK